MVTIQEYNHCVDHYSDALYRFARKSLNDSEVAKDLVQDAFEKLWLKLTTVESGKGKAYLFMTLHNAAIDFHRKEKKKTELLKNKRELNYEISPIDLNDHINRAVSFLSEIQRHVVMLRDYEGYSYQEIGEITQLSEQQVKVYIFRARQNLKEYLVSIDNLI
jgi:RNA polymerase sigma factor (sigma-70 family)